MSTDFKVLATDYHRNGSGGEGFIVALVHDFGLKRRFLVVDFCYDYEYTEPEDRPSDYEYPVYGYTAVLDIDQAHAGNIFMFPNKAVPGSGDNAWRGDFLGDRYRKAIREHWGANGGK
jgi:hypothetical protein